MSNIRWVNFSTTNNIYRIGYNQVLLFSADLKIKWKGNIMEYGCADTSFMDTGNVFVEFSQTKIRVILIGFDDDISKISISIGEASISIDVPNGTFY